MFGVDFAGDEDDALVVHPENWPAVRVFCAASTQWRIGPSLRLAGLDYTAARAAAAGIGVSWREVFASVRTMEAEVLAAQAEAA